MTPVVPQTPQIVIRPVQYRDLDTVERLHAEGLGADELISSIDPDRPFKLLPPRPWHGVLRVLSVLLHPLQYMFCACLAESEHQIQGIIRVSPFNRTRSTWRVDWVATSPTVPSPEPALQPTADLEATVSAEAANAPDRSVNLVTECPPPPKGLLQLSDVGSQLLRHCLATVWEARTWLLEVNVNDKEALALYRQTGFQPLAHMTYWAIAPETLKDLAEREPDLPNLLPVSNADAQLLYQLDTAAMPPLVRQVFDRHILDFKTTLLGSVSNSLKLWLTHTDLVSGYVFESQRKAAIGYFQLRLCRDGSQPHQAQLTVHPAYTWLYPELICQMAHITQDFPGQSLQLVSSDYQPEREEYLERLGATRTAHTLMMSRSVWHKLRETRPVSLEGLQLSDVLQGFKPARKPVPSRVVVLPTQPPSPDGKPDTGNAMRPANFQSETPGRGKKARLNLPNSTDFSDPPQEGPCC